MAVAVNSARGLMQWLRLDIGNEELRFHETAPCGFLATFRGFKLVTFCILVFSLAGNCFAGFGGGTVFMHASRVRNQDMSPLSTVGNESSSQKTKKARVHFQLPRDAQK